jgi:hypothetical protein
MGILEGLHTGITPDRLAELFQGATAFALQATNELGGIRVVALLAIIGFVVGLLACMLEIKMIKR